MSCLVPCVSENGNCLISEMYPLLISPSGEEMVIGAEVGGTCLPIMPKYESQLYMLMLDSWHTESQDG